MKTFLYAGAVLMVGASIYGFIDYKKSTHNKAFQNLYKETEAVSETKTNAQPTDEKTVVATLTPDAKKTMVVKTEPVTAEAKKRNNEKMTINLIEPKTSAEIKSTEVKLKTTAIKKKKKISTKLFSRAALDERYIEKEIIPVDTLKHQ
ncbi:MAG: hypothetical protein C4308_02275 [Chitinophagaceae bacterium]